MSTRIRYVPDQDSVSFDFSDDVKYSLNLGKTAIERYEDSETTTRTITNNCNTKNCLQVKCSSVQCSNVQCSSKQCSQYRQCVYAYADYSNKNCKCDCNCNCSDC